MGNSLSRVVFQPPATPSYSNNNNIIWLKTKGGENIPAYFINRQHRLTLLCSHGNAEDVGMTLNFFREVSIVWNVNLFAYEYIGYGLSTGVPSEGGVYDSVEAAFHFLTGIVGIPSSTIVAFGRSLGTGACCHIGSMYNVGGLILQSPLLSIHRVGVNFRFSLPCDMFCNIDKVANITCPIFIIHGTKDEIVPVFHGMELYKICKNSVAPYWVEGGGHNNIEAIARQEYFQNIATFIRFIENFKQGVTDDKVTAVV